MPCCHLSKLIAAIVAAPLVRQGYAHSCSNGSPVTCMAVQSSPDAHAIGEGFNAKGYPFCTPEGEKVFCLVDHNYHRCGSGEEPCCGDGSDPFHGSSGNRRRRSLRYGGRRMDGLRSYDAVTCKPPNVPSKVQAPEGTTARPKAVTFTLYKENYWCTSWGSRFFTTKVLWGEKSGVGGERMGDGNQSISDCAAYVAADADCSETFFAQSGVCECVRQGDICNGRISTEGNSIYRVGEVDAYVSSTIAADAGTTTGAATTKVATAAAAATTAKDMSLFEASAMATTTISATTIMTTTNTPEAEPMASGARAYKTGVLTLGARSDEGSDEALHDKLNEHKWVIQAVIEEKLGSPHVDVLRIVVARGRRLQASGNRVFEVHFQSRGSSISMSEANMGLKLALQESFVEADVGVIVEFVSLRWTSPDVSANAQQEEDHMFSVSVIVGLALAVLLTVTACGIFAKILMKRPTAHLTIATMNAVESPPDEKKISGFEVEESSEKIIINSSAATTFGLAQIHGEEKAPGIDVEKGFETSPSPTQWENNWEEDWEGKWEENWDESWEKKPEEKWEMRSSSTSEGGTRSQTSGGDTISESQTNDGCTTTQGTVSKGDIEGNV